MADLIEDMEEVSKSIEAKNKVKVKFIGIGLGEAFAQDGGKRPIHILKGTYYYVPEYVYKRNMDKLELVEGRSKKKGK